MMRVFRASGRSIDIPKTGTENTSTSLVDVINCISDELEALYKMLETPKKQTGIVRCKDCKHGEKVPTFKYYPDVTWCNKYLTSYNDDWFCADGERA